MEPINCKDYKQFILRYKQHTHLWDISDKNYMNRKKRLAALQDLRPLLGANATLDTVRKRIDILRTTYFREWRKVEASKATASSPSDVYTPTLWYYNLLSFLSKEDEFETYSFEESETENKSYLYALLSRSTDRDSSPIVKKEKRQSIKTHHEYTNVKKNLNQSKIKKEKRQSSKTQDELANVDKKVSLEKSMDYSFGLYLNQQLQKVPNDQKTYAEKIISDVLFMARTNQLNSISQIITPLESNYLSYNSDCD